MVLLKGVSKYFLVFLLLFSFLCPTNIYGAEDSKRTRSVEKGVVTERLYLSHLYNPYIRSYAELGYGIGNDFFNAAVFGSFHRLKFHEVGFKISLNIFKK